jgi:hypothetical protein
MTPFMLRIKSLITGDHDGWGQPELRCSVARTVGDGTHGQVELRSLAEQLVCEANAVLAEFTGSRITLEDHGGIRDLAFSLRYGDSWARVVTSFDDHVAFSQLLAPGESDTMRELAGPEALEDLIGALVATRQVESVRA